MGSKSPGEQNRTNHKKSDQRKAGRSSRAPLQGCKSAPTIRKRCCRARMPSRCSTSACTSCRGAAHGTSSVVVCRPPHIASAAARSSPSCGRNPTQQVWEAVTTCRRAQRPHKESQSPAGLAPRQGLPQQTQASTRWSLARATGGLPHTAFHMLTWQMCMGTGLDRALCLMSLCAPASFQAAAGRQGHVQLVFYCFTTRACQLASSHNPCMPHLHPGSHTRHGLHQGLVAEAGCRRSWCTEASTRS